ncbi:MAG: hypothetical protein AABY22_34445 [Nanoarchaeota archaeon]
MYIKEKQTVTETREVIVNTLCDMCSGQIDLPYKTRIEVCKTVADYDGGGIVEQYHVCDNCWSCTIVSAMKHLPTKIDF